MTSRNKMRFLPVYAGIFLVAIGAYADDPRTSGHIGVQNSVYENLMDASDTESGQPQITKSDGSPVGGTELSFGKLIYAYFELLLGTPSPLSGSASEKITVGEPRARFRSLATSEKTLAANAPSKSPACLDSLKVLDRPAEVPKRLKSTSDACSNSSLMVSYLYFPECEAYHIDWPARKRCAKGCIPDEDQYEAIVICEAAWYRQLPRTGPAAMNVLSYPSTGSYSKTVSCIGGSEQSAECLSPCDKLEGCPRLKCYRDRHEVEEKDPAVLVGVCASTPNSQCNVSTGSCDCESNALKKVGNTCQCKETGKEYDPETKKCGCPGDKPIYYKNSCHPCTTNSTYDKSDGQCHCRPQYKPEGLNCVPQCSDESGQAWDYKTSSCQCKNSGKPWFDGKTCRACGPNSVYHEETKTCECDEGFKKSGMSCVSKCTIGQTWSPSEKKCKCPDDRPVLYDNGECRSCAEAWGKSESDIEKPGMCKCKAGFKPDSSGQCVPMCAGANENPLDKCRCTSGMGREKINGEENPAACVSCNLYLEDSISMDDRCVCPSGTVGTWNGNDKEGNPKYRCMSYIKGKP